LVDSDFDLSVKSDFDTGLTDESSRGLATLAEKLESGLRAAVSDLDQSSVLTSRLTEENAKVGRTQAIRLRADDRLNLKFRDYRIKSIGLRMYRICCVLSCLKRLWRLMWFTRYVSFAKAVTPSDPGRHLTPNWMGCTMMPVYP
jgi:hypothetical protein